MTTHSMLRLCIIFALPALLLARCQGNVSGDEDAADMSDDVTDVLQDSPVDVPADRDLMDPVSDGEDDGSVPDADDPEAGDPDAVDLEEEDTPCQPRLFILLDRSASMLDGSPQRWNMVRQSLIHFLESVAAEGIEYGLGTFPRDNNCSVDGLVVHPLPEADLESVESFFATTTADGNTPLVQALEFLVTDSTANLDDEAALNALVVITDGWESCIIDCYTRCISEPNPITCMTACTEEIDADAPLRLATAATALRDERGVRTFVIGISEEVKDEQLSAIAGNGGTVDSEWISALTGTAIEDALVDIAEELKECLPIGP